MKPLYLEFGGVNSFSERASIDFEKLLEYGIFGIFGDTGSGKSTILDAIVFSLYGKVSRLDAKEAGIVNFINYHSDRAFVNFEFEIQYDNRRRKYRVERELKRKNAVQSARVYEVNGDVQSALAEGARDANALLERIIGLEQRDFEKCIALPQGEFAQFVKSARSDRLKLISRLFDLERYGAGLIQKINAKFALAQEESRVLKAKIEPYEGITEEGIAQCKRDVKRLAAEEEGTEKTLSALREEEKNLTALWQARKEAETVSRSMEALEAQREGMSAMNAELSRLERASLVVGAEKDLAVTREREESACKNLAEAAEKLRLCEEKLQKAGATDTQAEDREIARLTELAFKAKDAETTRSRIAEYNRRLEEIQREHADELENFKGFSYEEERRKLEEEIDSLGSGNFLSFVEEHGKAGLLRGEYATFAEELKELTRKHGDIAEDSAPLIEKYTALSLGDKTDFAALRKEFDEREEKRKKAHEGLVQLEKARSRYMVHQNRLQQLQTDRARIREELEKLPAVGEGIPSYAEAESALKRTQDDFRRIRAQREALAEEISRAKTAFVAAKERDDFSRERRSEAEKKLNDALSAGEFASVREAEELVKKYGNPLEARKRVEEYRERYVATRARLRELRSRDCTGATDEALAALRERLSDAEARLKESARLTALKKEELTRAERDIVLKKELSKAYSEKQKQAELYERLKKLLDGNKFMEYVAEEHLQTVAKNATDTLLSLTDGRYFLKYDNGFLVGDNYNAGAFRGVFTLSGGETFLVSLSLALALSREICTRSMRPIEFFFLDEGFGTLDEKLVDTVMDSLEKLRGKHFSIGIISHVEELRHRIERKLSVQKANERCGSKITME